MCSDSQKRSVEDLKERYYHICAKLANIRAVPGTDLKIPVFDAGHERRRKEQLERLYNRTPEQVHDLSLYLKPFVFPPSMASTVTSRLLHLQPIPMVPLFFLPCSFLTSGFLIET